MNKMKESFVKNRTGILLMLLSSVCACVGQLLWKIADGQLNLQLIAGFGFYGMGALIMLVAYKFGSLSVLQPMLSLNYILSIFLAALVLGENISMGRIVGVLIIIAGVILIGGGDD